MGHVGQKSTLCDIGQAGLIPGVFKDFLLFHLITDLIIDSSGAEDNTGAMAGFAHIGNPKLKILQFAALRGPKIVIKSIALQKTSADFGWIQNLG